MHGDGKLIKPKKDYLGIYKKQTNRKKIEELKKAKSK